MADVKVVAIRLKAINDDFKKGMVEAGDSTLSMSKVSAVALAAVGVAAAGLALKAADATVEWGKSIMKLSRISGDGVETMSKLAYAAQQAGGVTTDQLAVGLKFLEKNAASGNAEFTKLGVTLRDGSGQMRSTHEILLDTADAIAHMGSAAERTDAITKLFGRSGLALGPLLAQGRAGIMALEEEAKKYGLVLTDADLPAIQANIKAHRQLDAAVQGATIRIGEQMLPALTAVTNAFTKLPGPIATAIVPIAGITAGLLAVATVAPQIVTSIKAVAPAVKAMAMKVTENGTAMGDGLAVGAAIGIGLILKGLSDIEAKSQETMQALSGSIVWDDHNKSTEGLNKEIAGYEKLRQEYQALSGFDPSRIEKGKVLGDLSAQIEEDSKHFAAANDRIRDLGKALGITGAAASTMAASVHVDLTNMDPSKYLPIFRQLAAGTITTADATAQLNRITAASGQSSEDQTENLKMQTQAVKELNDAETGSIKPQMEQVDAVLKVAESKRKVIAANQGLTDSERAVDDAKAKVVDAGRKEEDASRKVVTAINAERDARKTLNDLMRGPSANEKDNIEAADIALIEARKRAAGDTSVDPALEARKNALAVRQAEESLDTAKGAHDVAVTAAQKTLADATQAVADARQAQIDAAKGVEDANKTLVDSIGKVFDAQLVVDGANRDVAKSAMDLDTANRNLNLAYQTQAVSMDQSVEALKRWVAQGLISQDQADSLKKSWEDAKKAADAANPDTPPTPAPQQGQTEVKPAATNNANKLPSGWAATAPPKHDAGGMLSEGMNTAGEAGIEALYKSGSNVWVKDAHQTRGLLTPHQATAAAAPFAGGSHGFTHNGDVIVQAPAGPSTPRDIAYEQRKLALGIARS